MSETIQHDWWAPEGNVWTPQYYLGLCEWDERTQTELQVLQQLVGTEPQHIIDVPCGFGRHSLALANAGHTVVGVDLNPDFLAIAQERAKQAAPGHTIHFIQGDMRSLGFRPGSFDVALNLFTSFGYFTSPEEDTQFFQETASLLKQGGKFILDLPNPSGKLAALQTHFESDYGPNVHVYHTVHYDPDRHVISEYRTYRLADGSEQHAELHTRMYTPEEIVAIGAIAGLRFSRLLDKNGNSYNPSTGRYWVELVKE